MNLNVSLQLFFPEMFSRTSGRGGNNNTTRGGRWRRPSNGFGDRREEGRTVSRSDNSSNNRWRGNGRGRGRGRGSQGGSFSNRRGGGGGGEFRVGFYKLKQWSEKGNEELATELYGNKGPFGKLLDRQDLWNKDDMTRFILTIMLKLSRASGEMMKKHIFAELSHHLFFWGSTLPNFLKKQNLYGRGFGNSSSSNNEMKELSKTVAKILVEFMRFSPSVGTSIPWTRYLEFSRSVGDTDNAARVCR